ncbi:zinc protease pqqL [Aquipluma nitroreducens]|uniref:Zinc protease pqqL n=1 Tax=Aquipluma nitroreducens TaxID=2010828 RepID=A0A5K7SDF3_9BACT|nr:insulinase family protein [Aquipluma nitroreducens]BBE19600.1 zinc protease pqqL [Aquipluma nitroreducens]
MRKTLTVIWILAATLCFGQPQIKLSDPLPTDPKVTKGVLANGMTYYVRANSTPKNRADLYLVVRAGSVEEDDNQMGLAHFAEHLAFNGTKNFPKHELINYLESIGMEFGPEINAYTSFDETVYMIKVPLDSTTFMNKGLQVLYDWASQVTDADDEIEKERGVIHEEWRGGRDADERMMQKWLPVFLHDSKYADRLPIGKMEIVDHFAPELLRKFRKDWYRPDLEAVVVVGDFDQQVMVKQITEMFSKIPAVKNPRKKNEYDVPNHKETLVSVVTDKEAQYAVAQIFYKHPLEKSKTVGDYRKGIVEGLYNAMINDRLAELTQNENPPFLMANSGYGALFGPKSVYNSVAVCQNGKIEVGIKTVLTENERVLKFGFTQSELDRQKAAMMTSMENAFNEREKQKSEAYAEEYKRNFLTTEEPFPGIENEYKYYQAFIPEIKLEEVNALAAKWITKENRVVILTAPEIEGVSVPTEADIRKYLNEVEQTPIKPYVDNVTDKPLIPKEPTAGSIASIRKIDQVDAEEWTLSNGAKVIVKSTDFKDDEILFSAYSLGGSSLYGQKDDVSAEMAPSILALSGLGDFDKVSLDKLLSGKAVAINPYISDLREGFGGGSSVKDAETLFQLICMYFVGQRTDQSAFNSFMSRTAGALENKKTSPEAAFQDTLQVVSANYSPRKRPMTAEILKEADLSRITEINHERFSDASDFKFFFVGKIDKEALKQLVVKYLASIPSTHKNENWKDDGIKEPSGIVEKTVYKGQDAKSMQYLVFHGNYEYSRRNNLLINALSKILTTRLLEVIREDKSSVYYIDANPSVERFPEAKYSMAINYGADPAKLAELKEAVFAQIKDIATNGPSAIDLQKAKEKLLRERETNLRENKYWLSVLSTTWFNSDADFSQFGDYENIVNSFTVEDIKAAANKWFDFKNYYGVALKPEAAK